MEIEEELGCVYFVKLNGLTPIKIGYSTNPTPSGRLESFAVSAPFGIELIGFIQTKNSKQLETILHQRFSAFRCSGEWFEISKEQARSCCEQYMDKPQMDKLSEAYLLLCNRGSLLSEVNTPYPTDFNEWANQNIRFNIRLSKSILFEDFINRNCKYELSLSQRKFTSWIESWCEVVGMECVQGKSDIRWIMIKNNTI
jgi:hypothetical protein